MRKKEQNTILPYFLSIIGAYALALSLSYNFAYFWKIDLKLFALLSLQDHLISALSWLLLSAPMIIILSVAEAMRVHFLAKHEKPDGHPGAVISGALIPMAIMWFIEKPPIQVMFILCVCIVWAALIPFMYNRLTAIRISNIEKYLLLMTPFILSYSFAKGLTSSEKDMVSKDYAELSAESQVKKVVILRNLDKGIIVRENNNYIFFTWDKIKSLSVSRNTPETLNEIEKSSPIVPRPE